MLLAIETTTEICSVGLSNDGDWIEDTQFAPRLHNQRILTAIDGVLRAAGATPLDLDYVAFSAGPGSFTGVRIGASVAQGIAFAANASTIRVPTSAALGFGLRDLVALPRTVCRRSRPRFFYEAEIGANGELLGIDRLREVDELPPMDDESFCLTARWVAEVAQAHLEVPQPLVELGAPRTALPFYVEGDSPWQPSQ